MLSGIIFFRSPAFPGLFKFDSRCAGISRKHIPGFSNVIRCFRGGVFSRSISVITPGCFRRKSKTTHAPVCGKNAHAAPREIHRERLGRGSLRLSRPQPSFRARESESPSVYEYHGGVACSPNGSSNYGQGRVSRDGCFEQIKTRLAGAADP